MQIKVWLRRIVFLQWSLWSNPLLLHDANKWRKGRYKEKVIPRLVCVSNRCQLYNNSYRRSVAQVNPHKNIKTRQDVYGVGTLNCLSLYTMSVLCSISDRSCSCGCIWHGKCHLHIKPFSWYVLLCLQCSSNLPFLFHKLKSFIDFD